MGKGRGKIYGHNLRIDINSCTYCGCSLDDYSRTVDHLIPESQGGILANKNKVPSCKDCNRLKDNMTPEQFHDYLVKMIRMMQHLHNKQIFHLRKVKLNTKKIIDSKHGNKDKSLETKSSSASVS